MRSYSAILAAPCAALGVVTADGELQAIDFLPRKTHALALRDALAQEVCSQLERYLHDPGFRFDLPLAQAGTPFQRRVWNVMMHIPSGATMTYSGLAEIVGSGARAVANACAANPVPIVVPCHRIVARHGLGGFMGGRETGSLTIKQWLLAHERGESNPAG